MEAAIRQLERQFLAGLARIGIAQSFTPQALLVGPLVALLPMFHSAGTRAAAKEMESAQARMKWWMGQLYEWAKRGRRDDGSLYDRQLWWDEGRFIGVAIQEATKEAFGSTTWSHLRNTAKDTGAAVDNIVDTGERVATTIANTGRKVLEAFEGLPDQVPDGARILWWLKVGAGVVGVGALALGGAYVWRAFK